MTTLLSTRAGPPTWRLRLRAPMAAAGGVLAAVAMLHVRDPHVPGSYGGCPVLYLTGFACPGCGGLRAVHHLSAGDLGAALSSNLLAVGVLFPLAVIGWVAWTRARWRGDAVTLPSTAPALAWAMLALVLLFGVVRNLPFAAWLAP